MTLSPDLGAPLAFIALIAASCAEPPPPPPVPVAIPPAVVAIPPAITTDPEPRSDRPIPELKVAGGEMRSGVVRCAGYDYPEWVTTSVSCTGALSGCAGSHEFLVVGCYRDSPQQSPCPSGYKIAGQMLIGQWAEAARVTRKERRSVCMYAGGDAVTTSACGFDVANYAYCWRPGDACCPRCPTNCGQEFCDPTSITTAPQGYQAPVLCVR